MLFERELIVNVCAPSGRTLNFVTFRRVEKLIFAEFVMVTDAPAQPAVWICDPPRIVRRPPSYLKFCGRALNPPAFETGRYR